MLHQQQGFYWQFSRTMRPVEEGRQAAGSGDGTAPDVKNEAPADTDVVMGTNPATSAAGAV